MTVEQQSTMIYPWHQQTWSLLTAKFPEIAHGLLFFGKNGCAKNEFTQRFVAWILCSDKKVNSACGECSSCLWLKSNTHPNYVHISTDEENKKANAKIKIEKIRDLLPFVQQTGEGWRVVVIEPAEALNIASANALLKTLEEPGERVVLILVADHYLKLPATIRSRLQHFALDRLTKTEAESFIKHELPTLTSEKLSLLLNLANDMPLTALELEKNTWIEKRSVFLKDWEKLVAEKNNPISLANKWAKEISFQDFLTMFEYLLGDLVAFKLNQTLKNFDLEFHNLNTYYHLEQLFEIYSFLQQAKLMTDQNVQSQLVMDEIFMKMMNVS